MLRQGFLSWLSKPGGTYRDIKAPVATLIIATWKILLRHCMKTLCRDKVMNVATLEDKVSGPDRETKSRKVMLT